MESAVLEVVGGNLDLLISGRNLGGGGHQQSQRKQNVRLHRRNLEEIKPSSLP